MTMMLQCKGNSTLHPEGIHPAICVDVIDLGLMETEFQGQKRLVPKVRLVFETEQRGEDGGLCTLSKTLTASLHPKARLADFLGKWRGRAVVPGETIDLGKLIGACCTLVISHQQNMVGRRYASIDAVSKPTKKVPPSGQYDPAETRRRIAEWTARETQGAGDRGQAPGVRRQETGGGGQGTGVRHQETGGGRQGAGGQNGRLGEASLPGHGGQPPNGRLGEASLPGPNGRLGEPALPNKSGAAAGAATAGGPTQQDYDPEVGF